MKERTFLLILLALVLWGRGVQGRGSTETWVEATDTTSSCTLDVVLVTFKDTTDKRDADTLDYHLHDLPYGTNEGQQATDRYKLADFERLFNGGYDANGAYDAGGRRQHYAFGGVRQRAGLLRFDVAGSLSCTSPYGHEASASHRRNRARASRVVCHVEVRRISPRPARRRARFVRATLRFKATCRPPNSSRIWTAPWRVAWSIRGRSRG